MRLTTPLNLRHTLRASPFTAAVFLFLLSALRIPTAAFASDYPAWWLARGVINTNVSQTNDYAAANQGMVKWFTTKACAELEANIPGGTGTSLWYLVSNFSATNNYRAVNAGQLKYVGRLIYDRLIDVGFTNSYPWTTNTVADDADYAVVNIGQVKHLFSFDLSGDADSDGMADLWETKWFGSTTSQNATDDYDEDGFTNLQEYQHGTDPTNADTDGDGVRDSDDFSPVGSADTDMDGLPDDWELHWFGNLAQTASGDPDGDGVTNINEYRAGTDPTRATTNDSGSALKLEVFTPTE